MQQDRSVPAVIYAAKSTQDRHKSIPTQLEDCREKVAGEEGWTVVGEFWDEGFSAYSGNRGPDLERARLTASAAAEQYGCACMLVAQASDRFARGAGDKPGAADSLIEIWHAMRRLDVHLRSVEDDFDLRDSASVANIGHRNMMDSRRKSASVRKGMDRRRKEGKYIGRGFFGSEWIRNAEDEREIAIRRDAIPAIRRIHAEALAGESQLGIMRNLSADRVPTEKGGEWHQATVRSILRNPAYAGLILDGDELIEATHEGVIDRADWEEVQALLAAKARTHGRGRSVAGKHLFRKGFLGCGECGSSMVPRTHPNRTLPPSETYGCYGKQRDPDSCSMPPIKRSEVDSAALAYFEQVGLDVAATREQLASAHTRKLTEIRTLLETAEAEANRAEARLAKVKRDYTHGDLTATEWRELRDELEPEGNAALAEAERLRVQVAESEAEEAMTDVEAEVLAHLTAIRAAVAGEITDATGVNAVRAALLRLFDGFILRSASDAPKRSHIDLAGIAEDGGYWLEPVVSERAIAGYDEKLRPELARKPLETGKNNYAEGLTT